MTAVRTCFKTALSLGMQRLLLDAPQIMPLHGRLVPIAELSPPWARRLTCFLNLRRHLTVNSVFFDPNKQRQSC